MITSIILALVFLLTLAFGQTPESTTVTCSPEGARDPSIVGFCASHIELHRRCSGLIHGHSEEQCKDFRGTWCCFNVTLSDELKVHDRFSFDALTNAEKLAISASGRQLEPELPVLDRDEYLKRCKPGDVVTQGNGIGRTNHFPNAGIDKNGSISVNWSIVLNPDEQIYAMPLIYCGIVFVAGMQNNVYQVDSETGRLIGKTNLGPAFKSEDIGCPDVRPAVGILATPVIDPQNHVIYMTYKTYSEGRNRGLPHAEYRLTALDAFTLKPKPGYPITISGSKFGKTFNASIQMQRPALLLLKGKIYIAFASHCDWFQYHGFIFKVDAATGKIDGIFITTGRDSETFASGIWQSGVGLSSDGGELVYAALGNVQPNGKQIFTRPLPGRNPPDALSQAVVSLHTETMEARDFFTPHNVLDLDIDDMDLGSGGVTVLPPEFSTQNHTKLGITVAKEGYLYLLDLDNLGGFQQGANNSDGILAKSNEFNPNNLHLYNSPSVWPTGKLLYLTLRNGKILAIRLETGSDGEPRFTVAGQSAEDFKFDFGTPTVVLSDGGKEGTATVWLNDRRRSTTLVFDAQPDEKGHLKLIASIPFNEGATKFAQLSAAHGRAYLGTFKGSLLAYASDPRL